MSYYYLMTQILATLLLAGCINISHASLISKHVTRFFSADGLPQNSVYAIAQDRQGFLWLGTQDGLARYDAYQFKTFRSDSKNPYALKNHWIKQLQVDADGRVWIGSQKGLHYFDPVYEQFHYLPLTDKKTQHNIDKISLFDDMLWVQSQGEVYRIDRKKPRVLAKLPLRAPVRTSYADPQNSLIVALTDHSLWQVTPQQNFKPIGCAQHPLLKNTHIVAILSQGQDHLWLGTEQQGLYRCHLKTGAVDAITLMDENARHITALYQDHLNRVWVATYGQGVFIIDKAQNQQHRLTHNVNDPRSLSNNIVWSLYQSHDQTLWLGSDKGLNRLDPRTEAFNHYQQVNDWPQSLGDNNIRAFHEGPSQQLWIATQNGLYRLKNGVFTTYKQDPARSHSLSSAGINAVLQTDEHTVWVGGDLGLERLDPETGQVVRSYQQNPDLKGLVNSLYQDRSGNLWLSIYKKGVRKWDAKLQRWLNFDSALSSQNILSFYQDQAGFIYLLSLDQGLFRGDPDTDRFESIYRHQENDPNTLAGDIILSLYEVEHGLWVGTDQGLNYINTQTGLVDYYGLEQGLNSRVVYGILPGKPGQLWLSTNNGLALFNKKTKRFRHFDSRHGIQNEEFNGAYLQRQNGQLLFGGIQGFNAFDPYALELIPSPIKTVFTGIWLNGKSIDNQPDDIIKPLNKAVLQTPSLILDYQAEQTLSFEFSGLAFGQPEQHQYRYRLLGFDDQWLQSKASVRRATFTGLPPGDYQLQVHSKPHQTLSWDSPHISKTALTLNIASPWWLTPWAYIFYAVLLVMVLLVSVAMRTQYLARRNRVLSTLVAEKTQDLHQQNLKIKALSELRERFFANISHEFRTPLTLILGPLQQILTQQLAHPVSHSEKELKHSLELAKRNGAKLLRLMQQLLNISRLRSGNIPLQLAKHDVGQDLKLIVASFKPMLTDKNITLSQTLPKSCQAVYDAIAFEQMISNLLSNAIKYTPQKGHIHIGLQQDHDGIKVTIKDSGQGIASIDQASIFDRFDQGQHSHHGQGSGIGLSLVKEWVKRHNGEITLTSEWGQGSAFTIRLPHRVAPDQLLDSGGTTTESALYPSHELELWAYQPTADTDSSKQHHRQHRALASDARPRVLIVEDNQDMQKYLCSVLNHYSLMQAFDGQMGLELAQREQPQLILSDVMMPKMDGLTLLKALRQDVLTAHIPVIVLTAKGGRDSQLEGLREGVDDYQIKPFDPELLIAKIDNLLQLRSLLAQRFAAQLGTQPADQLLHTPPQQTQQQDWCAHFEQVLARYYSDESFGPTQLASALNVSVRQLQRMTKDQLGKSPSEALLWYRLKQAPHGLQHYGSVGEVADRCGFKSHAHFSRCFKQFYGCAPSEYVYANEH